MSFLCRCVALAALLVLSWSQPCDAQVPSLKKVKDKVVKTADSAAKAPQGGTPAAPAPAPASEPAPAAGGAAPADSAKPAKADPKVWENYDFIPGNKVIVYTDFSDDKVGNFSKRLEYTSGSMDVVERDGVKMLRATTVSLFLIPVGRILPERFTLEFDIIAPDVSGYEAIAFEGGPSRDRGPNSGEIIWHPRKGTGIIGGGQNFGTSGVPIPESMQPLLIGKVAHIRVLVDGPYFKMYTNEKRMYNIPKFGFKRDSVIWVLLHGGEEPGQEVYLTRVRLAESETDVMYDALTAKGRWSTQGILFATGKSELQPESRPVLKEIAATMTKYGDLKILIEGHTDNVGQPAANLTLSDARAAAVKAALVADFGIAADRMETKGLGDTKPVAPNTTAEGRAQNRRVDVVKQ